LLLRRLGLAPPGVAPVRLADAGRIFGVTGAWIGHLERRTVAAARNTQPPVSLLAAVQLLGSGQPRSSADAALEVHAAGLTRDVLHPAGVAAAARIMSVPVRFRVVQTEKRSIVIQTDRELRAQRRVARLAGGTFRDVAFPGWSTLRRTSSSMRQR